jgi:UDP-N-acetylmuramoylalanine--D-glutamate ligase
MNLTTAATQVLQNEFSGKTVVIFGLGKEGFSSYQFIRKHLPEEKVFLTDDKSRELLGSEWQSVLSQDSHATYIVMAEIPQKLEGELVVIKTPGIPFTHQFFSQLSGKNAVYTANTELFFEVIARFPAQERPTTIGITGTKGKSTTTSLVHHVLKAAGEAVFLAGNIGVPALDVLQEMEKIPAEKLSQAVAVLELSSHQLQTLPYSPHIAVVQNITPEHLDYYQDFEEYWQAKAAITKYQTTDDCVIFNPTFEIPAKFAEFSSGKKYPFTLAPQPGSCASVQNGAIYSQDTSIIATNKLPLMGEHNLLNTLPAVVIAELFEIPAKVLADALSSFTSLPHRLEFVTEKNGVKFYNDSQATTPEAAIAAIKSFPEKEIILLAGGSDKGVAFDEFAQEILQQPVTHILLFPPTGAKIEDALQQAAGVMNSLPQIHAVYSMAEAVQTAQQLAKPGCIVLLSPACASFGLFKNYQDRGNQFKEAALSL